MNKSIFVHINNFKQNMILEKLSKIELEAMKTIANRQKTIKTIHTFKKLLMQIDFSSEVIPIENSEKLKELFTSLKNKELNTDEKIIIKEILK